MQNEKSEKLVKSEKSTSVSKEELFERMPVTKAIFTLTIPMIISTIISMF